jgi:hypothetical protein
LQSHIEMKLYQYKALEVDEIRLLELHAGDLGSELQASLHIFRLPEDEEPKHGHEVLLTRENGFDVPNAPEYQALSYTWGEDSATQHLLKVLEDNNFSVIRIKPNLDDALRQLRQSIQPNESQLFWIDSICINQDDILEKNTQIKKMAMIYNRADSVSVWLGCEDEDSRRAIDFIKTLVKLYDFDPLTRNPGTFPEWAALLNLMQRHWFNRRWIVQEIALARRATIFCGDQSVSWQDFASAVALFISRHQDLRPLFQSSKESQYHPNFLGEVEALGAKTLVDVTNNLFRKSDDGVILERLLSLEALISSLTAFEASSPHDTIYAVLWLAHDAEPDSKELAAMSEDAVMRTPVHSPQIDPFPSPSPEPDEVLPTLTLDDGSIQLPQSSIPKTAFPRMNRRSPSPARNEALNLVPRKGTWLRPPNAPFKSLIDRSASDRSLRKAEQYFEEDPEPIIVDYSKDVYEVCRQFLEFAITRSRSLDIICHPWAPQPLKREPKLPSWISQVSSAPFEKEPGQNSYSRVRADPLVGTPGNGSRNYNASGKTKVYPSRGFIAERTLVATGFVLDIVKVKESPACNGVIPSAWGDLIGWAGPPDPVPDRFWRTLVADRGSEGHKPPPAYFPLACKWVFEQRSAERDVNTNEILTSRRCPSIATEFLRRVQPVTWGRRLILSEGKRGSQELLGLAPAAVEEGDLICILYGCSVPVILRKRKKRRNADMPTFSHESTLEEDISAPMQDQPTFSVPQWNPNNTDDGASTTVETDTQYTRRLTSLAVPVETPSHQFSSHGVRKALGEGNRDRKPPSLTISRDGHHEYTFIGEAYIHGMMAGEGFKHRHEHRNQTKYFHLV